MMRDHLAIDEQDAGEAQGTIVVWISVCIDDCRAEPGGDFSANMILECSAGLSAPAGLLLFDTLKEVMARLWAGDCDCRIEVEAHQHGFYLAENDRTPSHSPGAGYDGASDRHRRR